MYFTPNITWVIKLRIMSGVEHMTHTEERRGTYRVLMVKLEVKRLLGRSRHRWTYNIKWILKKLDGRVWAGFIWLRLRISDMLL
jgi:hypothetical protein